MRSIPVVNQLIRSDQPLGYDRYIELQSKLRARRRELILFCQHPPTITGGVQARVTSLRVPAGQPGEAGINLVAVGRGGDYTAHEPGQCVIYPHVDLKRRSLGVPAFFDGLLRATSVALWETWGLEVASRKAAPGLYRNTDGAKLVSIGIMFKSFFTSHGIALNVRNDLRTFDLIHPCGFPGQEITSVERSGGDPDRLPEFLTIWNREFTKLLQ